MSDVFLRPLAEEIFEADKKYEIRQQIEAKKSTDERIKTLWNSISEKEKQDAVDELYRYLYKR